MMPPDGADGRAGPRQAKADAIRDKHVSARRARSVLNKSAEYFPVSIPQYT